MPAGWFLELKMETFKMFIFGKPGWLSWLNVQLQLRSWSCGLWVGTPCQALCWQLRTWNMLQILCLPLCPSRTHVLSLSVPQKWIKCLKKFIVYFNQKKGHIWLPNSPKFNCIEPIITKGNWWNGQLNGKWEIWQKLSCILHTHLSCNFKQLS